MTENPTPRRVKTVPFRMSFPHLLEPRQPSEDNPRKVYQLAMLFPPGTDMKPVKDAMRAAMIDKYGADQSKWPRLKRGPNDVIRDAKAYSNERVADGKKPLAGYDDGWLLLRANATEKFKPSVVGPIKGTNGKFPVITEAREIYAGRWARATIEAFVYERKDGKGITFGLSNVQLLKHDANIGGAVSAPETDFEDAPEEWSGGGDAFDNGGSTDKASGEGW